MEAVLPRIRARRKRIKPPPPDWMIVAALSCIILAALARDVMQLLGGEKLLSNALDIVVGIVWLSRSWPHVLDSENWPGWHAFIGSLPMWLLPICVTSIALDFGGM